MWDPIDDAGDDWEPLRTRRAGAIRLLAILVVVALVLALVIPALMRLLGDGVQPDPEPGDGIRVVVVGNRMPPHDRLS